MSRTASSMSPNLGGLTKSSELRQRIFFVIFALIVFRLGSFITLPGIDPAVMSFLFEQQRGSILDMFNMFSGGSLSRMSIFALGVMPYISASIVVQLMGVALPYLQKLQKEGESGRKKITQITRWLTIAICVVQAPAYLYGLGALGVPDSAFVLGKGPFFIIPSVIILVTGCIFAMWLGEKITDRGIGNGISLIIFSGIILSGSFVGLSKTYPDLVPNRIDTWSNRIENFINPSLDNDSNYQINRAKAAIASGSIFGVGAGKSSMKYILPQSTSDFIFSIVTEEYGLFVALIILLLYVILLFRIVIVSQKSNNYFGKLLALAVGLPIVFQALINMGVAVQLFPVTGQPLPLISTGGTSIWTTFFAFGVLLSVSRNNANIMELDLSENVNE